MSVRSFVRTAVRRLGYELTPVQALLAKEVRNDYAAVLLKIGEYRFKFLDVKTFLPMAIQQAYVLGLHKSPPLEILDIGTGVGYFPVVCRHYGHQAIAIDRDGEQVFMDATKWLGVDRRAWEIHRLEPLPDLGSRFDLATAFLVKFDREHEHGPSTWSVDDWTYFLCDLALNHLKPDGRIALTLGGATRKRAEVLRDFVDKGAKVSDEWVIFDSLSALLP